MLVINRTPPPSWLPIVALLLGSCSDDPDGTSNTPDLAVDSDSDEDLSIDGAVDTSDSDVAADTDARLEADTRPDLYEPADAVTSLDLDFDFGACDPPPVGEPPVAGRWSLSLFHFNVQYVAGGTLGLAEQGFNLPGFVDELDLSARAIEDRIITESLVPLLVILERNPDLALTVEMQGLMVDVIAERFPGVLARMQVLVDDEQLELASIHWSDQFFLAFGRNDMDESWRRTQSSFAEAELPLSRVVFAQEGQFGEGFAEWLLETRPDAIAVLARNLQGFFNQGLPVEPLWSFRGLRVVAPRGVTHELVDRQWNFFDDGELLATGDLNPYAGREFAIDREAVARYEHRLRCDVERGYTVGRIADYIEAIEATDFVPPEHPPLLDGTWQPPSTRGPLRWLGGGGDLWARHESDNLVLTTCVAARQQVLALQTVVDDLGGGGTDYATELDSAWRDLLLGQVSDARGVNPWLGEVRYGLEHCATAGATAAAALLAELERRDAAVLAIDTADGSVTPLAQRRPEPTFETVAAPLDVSISAAGGRDPELRWERADDGTGPYRLTIDWPATDGQRGAFQRCLDGGGFDWECRREPLSLAIQAPRTPGLMAYRPARALPPVPSDEGDFSLHPDAFDDAVWSVAADGFIDLGEDRYLIKDTRHVHLAVGWPAGAERNGVIEMRDETLDPHVDDTWVFWYTTDRDEALVLAARNLQPVVYVP